MADFELPKAPVDKILTPFARFLKIEVASGIILLAAAILAMLWANSPWSETYHDLLHLPVDFRIGKFALTMSLHHLINDGLMVIFFFVVGLEIKRELSVGELSTPKKAALPIAGAIGGMLVPALIYAYFNHGQAGAAGWGIPMATDIAFAVGVLALLGPRVPFSIKIFLLALAIVDDLGAVLAIAFFYTDQISGPALGLAALLLGVVALLNRIGVRTLGPYVVLGFFIWLAVLKSGVHATIAGVVLGLMTPVTAWLDPARVGQLLKAMRTPSTHDEAALLRTLAVEVESPLDRLVHTLHPWVSFVIMPIFALANSGVTVAGVSFDVFVHEPIFLGVALGLLIGKPVGIASFSWLAVKAKIAEWPRGIGLGQIVGIGLLGGIGFTMSLFISGLALKSPELEVFSKMGILLGSTTAGLLGYVALRMTLKNRN